MGNTFFGKVLKYRYRVIFMVVFDDIRYCGYLDYKIYVFVWREQLGRVYYGYISFDGIFMYKCRSYVIILIYSYFFVIYFCLCCIFFVYEDFFLCYKQLGLFGCFNFFYLFINL